MVSARAVLSTYAEKIPVELLCGLKPRAWLCVGAGFSREEIKEVVLSKPLVSEAITTIPDLCSRLLGVDTKKILSSLARQEVLRMLLGDSRISAKLPELKRLKRQSNFYRRLDLAIQSGRLAFAHSEEEAVLYERLESRVGPNPVREELRLLAFAYETWMNAEGLWDQPMLLRAATEQLELTGWPGQVRRPESVFYFSGQFPESRERAFWDALARQVEIHRVGPVWEQPEAHTSPEWRWEKWHTLDDAADALSDELAAELAGHEDLAQPALLFWDGGSIRRSMNRALEERGLPLADPRDPTQTRWEEAIKWAMLPIEVVARGYERERVVSFLRAYLAPADPNGEFSAWVREIYERGIRQGLLHYAGGKLANAYLHLEELQSELGGRKTCEEIAESHLRLLRSFITIAGSGETRATFEIILFFEGIWNQFVEDTARLGLARRKAPALYWLERLQGRVQEASPPVGRLKPAGGLRSYRLQQAPLISSDTLYVLGLPPGWLDGDGVGDYWFTAREREVLNLEFSVRSAAQVREERARALLAWLSQARSVVVLDAEFDADGRERENLAPLLAELVRLTGGESEPEPVHRGSHPRWAPSFGALRPVPPQKIQLPSLARQADGSPPVITATALDRYSRCAFQALVSNRWKLWETEEPDTELWPNIRGEILHHAVRVILQARGEGRTISTTAALDEAWTAVKAKGLLKGERVKQYARTKLLRVLEAFLEKEREYFERAQATPVSLDDRGFRLDYPDFSIIGTPDRVDEAGDGVFIMDYKTGSGLPNGTEMLEKGYRLQLPFYALAASRAFGKKALGVQFVELTRDGKRSSGVFFERYNGKEPGKLTKLRKGVKSLFNCEPEEVWSRFEDQIVAQARSYVAGDFEAKPKKSTECNGCHAADLCGFRRLSPTAEETAAAVAASEGGEA